MSAKNKKHGFSLIELIAVMAVIGIIVAIAVPSYQSYKSKAKSVTHITSLKNVYVGINLYAADNNAKTPNIAADDFDPDSVTEIINSYSGKNNLVIPVNQSFVNGMDPRLSKQLPAFAYIWQYSTITARLAQSATDTDLSYFPMCIPVNVSAANNFILFADGKVANRIQ